MVSTSSQSFLSSSIDSEQSIEAAEGDKKVLRDQHFQSLTVGYYVFILFSVRCLLLMTSSEKVKRIFQYKGKLLMICVALSKQEPPQRKQKLETRPSVKFFHKFKLFASYLFCFCRQAQIVV